MNDSFKVVLKKLDEIDARLKNLERSKNPYINEPNKLKDIKRDPLFAKALEVIDRYEEISSVQLSKELKIDVKRAEEIMDQLEKAGIGACYFKEV